MSVDEPTNPFIAPAAPLGAPTTIAPEALAIRRAHRSAERTVWLLAAAINFICCLCMVGGVHEIVESSSHRGKNRWVSDQSRFSREHLFAVLVLTLGSFGTILAHGLRRFHRWARLALLALCGLGGLLILVLGLSLGDSGTTLIGKLGIWVVGAGPVILFLALKTGAALFTPDYAQVIVQTHPRSLRPAVFTWGVVAIASLCLACTLAMKMLFF